MTNFFAVRMPPGPGGDEFVEHLNRLDARHRVSNDTEKLTKFLRSDPDSPETSLQGIFASEKAGGVRRLGAGRDSSFKLNSIGKDPFGAQSASSFLQNHFVVGGSAMNSNFPLLSQEPHPLNAVDILLGTSPGCRSSATWSSGDTSVDSVVKKEEQDEEYPLFTQNPPPQQEIFPLFKDVDALVKEEFDEDAAQNSGTIEGLVKEEEIDDDFGRSGDYEEDIGERGAYKGASDDLFAAFFVRGHFYQCKLCDVEFPLASLETHFHTSSLKNHWRLHPLCKYCHTRFRNEEVLTEHKRIHTTCDVCGKIFPTGSQLKIHQRRHTGEKPFQCEHCEASYSTGGQLKMHTRLHTGESTYECEVCQMRFTRKYTLTIHLRTHTGEKPYQCPECEKKFANSSNRNSHRRRVHGLQKTSA